MAIESRDGQQHHWIDDPELGDRSDYRAGANVDFKPQRLGKRERIVVLLGAARFRISGSESGRGARGAEPRGGGSFAHPTRCQYRHGQRLPRLARYGTDRARRASRPRAPGNLREIGARACRQPTPRRGGRLASGCGARPRAREPRESAATGGDQPRATRRHSKSGNPYWLARHPHRFLPRPPSP